MGKSDRRISKASEKQLRKLDGTCRKKGLKVSFGAHKNGPIEVVMIMPIEATSKDEALASVEKRFGTQAEVLSSIRLMMAKLNVLQMEDRRMSELEFTKKPRRMVSPPQNQRRWLPGYEGVEVVMETEPERMAYFAREATWGDIMLEPTQEELMDTLREVQGGRVLGAAFKGGIGFRIRASRSSMDQMLRLAEGSGGAGSGAGAQTTRDNDQRKFNIIVPNTIINMPQGYGTEGLYQQVVDHIDATRQLYADLVDAGIPPQDARYVALPLGFQTQWFHVMSLGNMIKMCEQRLCNGLTQHETNYLVRVMRDLVVKAYPFMCDNLRSGCEKRGKCATTTMLFPGCGAFVKEGVRAAEQSAAMSGEKWDEHDSERAAELYRLHITKYDPERHLYPASANDAMQFAQWDIERQKMENERPEAIFSMAGPPKLIGFKVPEEDVFADA